MHRARGHSLGQSGHKNYLASVIEGFYKITILDSPGPGVLRIQADNPIRPSILFQYTVVFDLVYPALLAVTHGMEAEARVGTDQVKRILGEKSSGVVAFPGWHILGHDCPLRIVGSKAA
jgi:hypothetical protein